MVEELLAQRQRHIAAELHPQHILTLGVRDLYTATLYRVNYSAVYSSLFNGIVCSLLIILLPRYYKIRHKYSQPMERFLAFVVAVQTSLTALGTV